MRRDRPVTESLQYSLQQARKDEAYSQYNAASLKLDLATIKCRLAEILSQHEPLAGIAGENSDPEIRKKLYAAAYFVVIGRLPDGFPSTVKKEAL